MAVPAHVRRVGQKDPQSATQVSALVHWLQIASGVLWLGPLAVYFPSFLRMFRRDRAVLDAVRIPLFANAATQVGFILRWLFWSHSLPLMSATELTFWAGCYVVSALSAALLCRAYFVAGWLR